MNRRGIVLPPVTSAVAAAVVLVATTGGASPAARTDGKPGSVDLFSSAHPSGALPTVVDRAVDLQDWVRGFDVNADTAALTSTTCAGCVGESTTLQVIYADRARGARLDNVATAWAQECEGCRGTALSVQVVVLRGRPRVVPNNRALSATAGCVDCRTSALAYQVVLVDDDAEPMGRADLTALRAWFDEQAAAVRASVTGPLPEPPPTEPTPTAEPTPTPEPTPTLPSVPTGKPTPTIAPPTPSVSGTSTRRVRRDATSALAALERIVSRALDADVRSSDVELSR